MVEYALMNGQRGLGVITGTGQVRDPVCSLRLDISRDLADMKALYPLSRSIPYASGAWTQ